jgi:N-acetylglucosaminyldiphosphoundecaprenol N-acetyl-beta-D-mannosaminyltransferase
LFGIEIDPVRLDEAADRVLRMAREPGLVRYVVTPNLDHSMELQRNAAFRAAYGDASLVIADGWPLVVASHVFRCALPERVAGSDLVPTAFDRAPRERPVSVYLLGAGHGVAERARVNIEKQYPGIRIAGTYSPPFGFERDRQENQQILVRIAECAPQILIVGLGAPKQELWVHANRPAIRANVALCVGATIDFLAGEKPRAPRWMQRLGVEWAHRMASEPRRLVPRYAKNAAGFPWLLAREWRARNGAR